MFWITTILFIVSLYDTYESKSHIRVLNGRDVEDGEFPFVVTLLTYKIYIATPTEYSARVSRFCTGSAISLNWILTAAHCTFDKKPNSILIWHTNFTTNKIPSEMVSYVRKIIIHPSYRSYDGEEWLLHNDVSLLFVSKLVMDSFGVLLAVDHLTMVGLPVTYIGGGGTGNTKPGYDDMRPMQAGEAAIVPCSGKLEKYVICLAAKCKKTDSKLQMPWPGDSGGPLLHEGRIIGVCSYGSYDPEIMNEAYAAISPHINWIYKVIENKFNNTTPSIPAIN